ncbi:hypothetical protein D1AOALGA4SA_7337 [Olavius algarvensis Delta 1 endosymbiont]|nr:hypothetical protein D1AOALGA4SA_7337 [Olavius algarvensis Delta 1 endosymbiont]
MFLMCCVRGHIVKIDFEQHFYVKKFSSRKHEILKARNMSCFSSRFRPFVLS